MKITINIKSCGDCPYYRWVDDISCSNSDGNSECKKEDRYISEDKDPKIPKWCPMKGK